MCSVKGWRHRGAAYFHSGASQGCGCEPSFAPWPHRMRAEQFGSMEGGFGVRRPLRFLAYKLQLEEHQVAELARILDELKTERAQAAVDDRRTLTAFADAVAAEAFDPAQVAEAVKLRLQSNERLQSAVGSTLGRIHALLTPEQRTRLAYLIRTGALLL